MHMRARRVLFGMPVNETKVQVDHRNDGLITMTIKLVGWDLNRLRALISGITMHPMGRTVGGTMARKLEKGTNDEN